jgi:choline dehydrogenase-like flavoprotein
MPEYHRAKAENPTLRDPTETPEYGPHIQWFSTEAYGGYEEQLDFPQESQAAISLTTLLLNPLSKGTVRLSSYHPLAPPKIDHAYLPNPLDVALFVYGCRVADDIIVTGAGTKEKVTGPWPPSAKHPTTVQGWKDWVVSRLLIYWPRSEGIC